MAKKDLAGLVGGIIGKPSAAPSTPAHPDNNRIKAAAAAETRATFICDPEQIRKMKYIALASGKLHKQVVSDAFGSYIAAWEREHGTIDLPST